MLKTYFKFTNRLLCIIGEDSGLQVHKSLTADPTPIAQEHTDKRMIECMTSEERTHACAGLNKQQ